MSGRSPRCQLWTGRRPIFFCSAAAQLLDGRCKGWGGLSPERPGLVTGNIPQRLPMVTGEMTPLNMVARFVGLFGHTWWSSSPPVGFSMWWTRQTTAPDPLQEPRFIFPSSESAASYCHLL